MFNSFSSALAALKAHSAAVDTVGHNLANLNTTGFKASSVQFKDLVAEALSARNESGMGVTTPMTVRSFTQGAIQSSSGKLDAAIPGNGFFVVKDSADLLLYTRDGSFVVDKDGVVKTLTGERVQQIRNGAVSDIVIPAGSGGAKPTANMIAYANLNAGSAVGTAFSTPIEVVDSLGARHSVSMEFTKTGDNAWSFAVSIPAADLKPAGVPALAAGTMTFNQDGTFDAFVAGTGATAVGGTPPTGFEFDIADYANGAADATVTWSFFDGENKAVLTQYAQNSGPSKTSQDGVPSGELTEVGLIDGGIVSAVYTNGLQDPKATLAVALVGNPDTMVAVGNNLFRATNETSQPLNGVPGVGGRGQVKAQALEASTVDMAREFTNLIVYQRGYQANSRVITTSDEMSQETLSLKR